MLLIGQKFASTNQKHYPDLGSGGTSVWNFCIRFTDVNSRGNQWSRRECRLFTQAIVLLTEAPSTRIQIVFKSHIFLHESAFRPRETSEPAEWILLDSTGLVNSCRRLKRHFSIQLRHKLRSRLKWELANLKWWATTLLRYCSSNSSSISGRLDWTAIATRRFPLATTSCSSSIV